MNSAPACTSAIPCSLNTTLFRNLFREHVIKSRKREREGTKQTKTGERCKQVGENIIAEPIEITIGICTVVVLADGFVGVAEWE